MDMNTRFTVKVFAFLYLTLIANAWGATYFVNDSSTNGDVYCSSAGSNANNGLASTSPALRIQYIVTNYTLSAGDIVYIDTGAYGPVSIGASDNGSSGNPVVFQGSTNVADGGSVVTNAGGNAIYLNGDYFEFHDLTISNANYGVYSFFWHYPVFDTVRFLNCTRGLYAIGNQDHEMRFNRCIFANNGHGIYPSSDVRGLIVSNSVFYNNTYAVRQGGSVPNEIHSSIVAGGRFMDAGTGGAREWIGNYNLFWDLSGFLQGTYNSLYAYAKDADAQWNSSYANPHFLNPDQLDFHCKSIIGTYSNGSWVAADVHSYAIDFGNSLIAVTNEAMPNGARMNAGLYGNTLFASQSRTNPWLFALTYNDGGLLEVPSDKVYWNAQNIATDETVRIEVSLDGQNWESTPVATGLLVTAGEYLWANTNNPAQSSTNARWRVVLESDTNVLDACDSVYEHKNGSYIYYVNDGSLTNDGFGWGVGNDSNPGLSKAAPKRTLQSILNSYILTPGDRVYFGSGLYVLTSDQTMTSADSGTTNVYVYLIGHTNKIEGGTIFSGRKLYLNGADYISIQDIIFKSADYGLQLNNADGIDIRRCVFYQNNQDGVRVQSSSVNLKQSVFWKNAKYGINTLSGSARATNCVMAATGPTAACVYGLNASSFIGDFNNWYAESNAVAGVLGSVAGNLDTLSAWQYYTQSDMNSLSGSPRFADPGAYDFHLKSAWGRYMPGGGWTNDAVTSRLIDSGDPDWPFVEESAENGKRVNIGLYGNTGQASLSTTSAWLYAALPRDGGWLKGTGVFHWVAGGAATGHTVSIDFSGDGGQRWTTLTNGLPATNEILRWNTYATNDTPAGVWRIRSETDGTVTNQSSGFFAIRNASLNIYVNDASTAGDIFCMAEGAPTNYEASADAPLSSVKCAVDCFDLEPGDRIYVDTGIYTGSGTVVIGRLDSGSSAGSVRFLGSTNESIRTVFQAASNSYANVRGYYASYVTVSNVQISGGSDGVWLSGGQNWTLQKVSIVDSSGDGVDADSMSALTLRNALIRGNTGYGINGDAASGIRINQSIIWSNIQGAIYLDGGNAGVTNSILTANGSGRYIYKLEDNAKLKADYNDLLLENSAFAGVKNGRITRTIVDWQTYTTNDISSLSHMPRFANLAAGDFHLKTTYANGRYEPGLGYVTNDAVFSPLIDAGDPGLSVGGEPSPNGHRANIGLYGRTSQSSLSPTGGWFVAVSLNNGGSIRGSNTLYWLTGGTYSDACVNLQFTVDGGASWSNIATGLSNTNRYIWDTGDLTVPQAYWRVIDCSSNAWDTNDAFFQINNGPISYYVNDSNTNGDIYTQAPGSAGNPGTDEFTPKASVQQVLDAYVIREGDRIYVDTGVYSHSAPLVFEGYAGSSSNQFMLIGSTNCGAGGSIIDFNGSSYGLVVTNCDYAVIRHFIVRDADVAVSVAMATNTSVEWIRSEAADNTTIGFEVFGAKRTQFAHCLALRGRYGLHQRETGASDTRWVHGVSWSNNEAAIYMELGSLGVTNSIFGVFGSEKTAYLYEGSSSIRADYNNYLLRDGAYVSFKPLDNFDLENLIYNSVARWARDTDNDLHSLTADPLFADAGQKDFHLLSAAGRYDDTAGSFTNDSQSSLLIDAGYGVYSNEVPAASGGRVNIGLYGNSVWASKTPTNGTITAITVNDGGRFEGTNALFWTLYGSVTGHTVTLEYSPDAGTTWTQLVAGVAATNRGYLWNSMSYTSSILGLWRITSDSEPAVTDVTDTNFALRNTALYFYVNDESNSNDVYCSSIGIVTNDGLSPLAPKLTVQSILDAYDLEGGDVVYVDSGDYGPTGFTVDYFDAGDSNGLMTVKGSTNHWPYGSTFGAQVSIQNADYAAISYITVSNGTSGVRVYNSDKADVQWIRSTVPNIGFQVSESTDVAVKHCVGHENQYGIRISSKSTVQFDQGVLWSNTQYAVYLDNQSDASVSNSVAVIEGKNRVLFYSLGGVLYSDYNNLIAHNGAYVGQWRNSPLDDIYETLGRWVTDYGQDIHSLSVSPLFANPADGDYHLRTQAPGGRYDPTSGVWVSDAMTSPLIDAGSGSYTNEPMPNGAMRNIGLFGHTGLASLTPTNGRFTAISYSDGGRISGTVTVYWVAAGAVTDDLASVDYSYDGGRTWTNLATGQVASSGAYVWDTTLVPSTPIAVWRIRSESETNVWDISDSPFAVANDSLSFYVNDASVTGDVYTTAFGSETNSGALPGEPLLQLSQILTRYDLEAGDTIYIDTGFYEPTNNLQIGQLDAGNATLRMRIRGSTNRVVNGTVWADRGFELSDANGVEIEWLTFSNVSTAISYDNSHDNYVKWVTVIDGGLGIKVNDSERITMDHMLIAQNSSYAVQITKNGELAVDHSVLWNNGTYSIYLDQGYCSVSNTIIGVSGNNRYAYYYKPSTKGSLVADYNNIFLTNGAYAGYWYDKELPEIYQNVARWTRDFDVDDHTLSHAPGFADASRLDFHLKTVYPSGRYQVGVGWTNDTESSLLIDAGFGPGANELSPSGACANIGLYGDTWEASKTPTNSRLTAITVNDGGRFEGSNMLYWAASGDVTGHTARLEFSADNGATWQLIVSNVDVSAGGYGWNSLGYTSSIVSLWRMVSEYDPAVSDVTDDRFALRNDPLYFYVNDSTTADDIYCSAVGNGTNWGIYAYAPQNSIQNVLDDWDLEPGDTILVDAGNYTLNSQISIGRFDRGMATNRMTIQGSTNDVVGKTIFNRFGNGNSFYILRAKGLALNNMKIVGGTTAVNIFESPDVLCEWLICRNNGTAFSLSESDRVLFRHNVVKEQSSVGIYSYRSEDVEWQSGVLYSNVYNVELEQGDITVENSALIIGEDEVGYYITSGGLSADYNNLYIPGDGFAAMVLGAAVGGGTSRYTTASAWKDAGYDGNSISFNPYFADPANDDFHIRSQGGRYTPGGGWVTDVVSSAMIDAGDPLAEYTNEPALNGDRLNIGLYGNTPQASRTPDVADVRALSFNDGGFASGAIDLTWQVFGSAQTQLFDIAVSIDSGSSWTTIVSGVIGSNQLYSWDSSSVGSTPFGRWRLVGTYDTNIHDQADSSFYFRNPSIAYYVNDGSTAGDVYTTDVGNDSNTGTSPSKPKASIQSVIDSYDLRAGDVVYIDSGTFNLTQNIYIDYNDFGVATNPLVIQGSTSMTARTVVDRGTGADSVFDLWYTAGLSLRDMTIQNSANGISGDHAQHCSFERIISREHSGSGFYLYDSDSWRFNQCVAWNNISRGLYLSLSSASFDQGVVWGQNQPSCVYLSSSSISVSNSALQANGSSSRIYSIAIGGSVKADYNNYEVNDGAYVAEKANVTGGNSYYITLTDFRLRYGQDEHSLMHEPYFADEDNGDFHPMSKTGRRTVSNEVTDAVQSPMIDTADPGVAFTNEPSPNGSRMNIGLYGNTWQASKSLTNGWLLAISWNDGATFSYSNSIRWAYGNLPSNSTVTIQYSANNGLTWQTQTTNQPIEPEFYLMDLSSEPFTQNALWRLRSNYDTSVVDVVDQRFVVRNEPQTYYLNDTNTLGDIYCTAPGDVANSGTNAASPLPSPEVLWERYVVSAGDIVYIDTGHYHVTNSWVINEASRGSESNPIIILGSTNRAAGGTVMDWGYRGNGLSMDRTTYIEVYDLTITRGSIGVSVNNSVGCALTRIVSRNNLGSGFRVASLSTPTIFNYCTSDNNDGYGIYIAQSDTTIDHFVAYTNDEGAVYISQTTPTIQNSILHAFGDDAYIYKYFKGGINSDYNVLWLGPGAMIGYDQDKSTIYPDLLSWQDDLSTDASSLLIDPLFVSPTNGDFHLQSRAGRWEDGTGWTSDSVTSWAIDAGNPTNDFNAEISPNGGRINIGLYGNRWDASLTDDSVAQVLAVNLRDGGAVSGTQPLRWLYRGLQDTNTVTVQYSLDAGLTWTNIVTGLSITSQVYQWNTTNYPSTPVGLWRLYVEADTNVLAQSSDTNTFFMRNGPIDFYVNDDSTVGDIYALAVGSSSNVGTTPSSPLRDISEVLTAYDLEEGDVIFVDAGYYPRSGSLVIGVLDEGDTEGDVTIQGSTNPAAPSIIDFTNQTGSLYFNQIDYVKARYLILTNGGVNFYRASRCGLDAMSILEAPGNAVYASESSQLEIRRIIASPHQGGGYFGNQSSGIKIDSSLFWAVSNSTVTLNGGAVTISNSILIADGNGMFCYEVNPVNGGSIKGDYNNIIITNGAYYAIDINQLIYEGLPQWVVGSLQDVHSLSHEPRFADVGANDYRPRSVVGRFVPASNDHTAADADHSPLIDTGALVNDYTNEPSPNGMRLNIGPYGNTYQASMSQTNPWLLAISANAGGRIAGTYKLVWAGGAMAGTNEVLLDYSYDNGATWKNIETPSSLALNDYEYIWDSAVQTGGVWVYLSSPIARWRIRLAADSNVVDVTDNYFALRNYPFAFYVNDDSTSNDVYTTGVGNNTNIGFFADRPKRTLQAMLDAFDFEAEDQIYVDTGVYTASVQSALSDSGSDVGLVEIIGSTNDMGTWFSGENSSMTIDSEYTLVRNVYFGLDSQFNGNGDNNRYSLLTASNCNMRFSGSDSIASNLMVYSGDITVSGFDDSTIREGRIQDGQLAVNNCSGSTIERMLVYGGSKEAVNVNASANNILQNCTLYNSGFSAFLQRDASSFTTLKNNILIADARDTYCIEIGGGTLVSDYNNLAPRNDAWVGNRQGGVGLFSSWERLMYWQNVSGQDANSLSADPEFVNESGDDYRLLSASPSVDAGDPSDDVDAEPSPNGGRINQGVYGGTWQAATSSVALFAKTANDGGVVGSTNVSLAWNYAALSATNTVSVYYSTDDGQSWTLISGGLDITDGSVSWDTSSITNSFFTRWQVVLDADTAVLATNSTRFAVRNQPFAFYVNDTNTTGDVYCTAPGSATNNGLSAGAPRLTLQSILMLGAEGYDTQPGDTVYIDTGYYMMTNDVTIIWSRSAFSATNELMLQGSTNEAAGGAVLDRADTGSTSDGIQLFASHVRFRDLTLASAQRGIYSVTNAAIYVESTRFVSNVYGLHAHRTYDIDVRNSIFRGNTENAVRFSNCRTGVVEYCTVYGSQNYAFNIESPVDHRVKNNIVTVNGASDRVFNGTQSAIFNSTEIDYNIYHLGANATIYGTNKYLKQWQLLTDHDYRSWTNPATFANAAAGDFHLASQYGRYDPASGWVTDLVHSVGIDAADPNDDYANETYYNGARANLGAYGNTEFASRSGTNLVTELRTLNNSNIVIDANDFVWPMIWHIVNWPTDVTVRVEASGDGGTTTNNWRLLTNGIPAYREYYVWQLNLEDNTFDGIWRIVGEGIYSNYIYETTNEFQAFWQTFAITNFEQTAQGYNKIDFTGAWGSWYRVDYTTNAMYDLQDDQVWIQAFTGSNDNQRSLFQALVGGDQSYIDLETGADKSRWYRVVRLPDFSPSGGIEFSTNVLYVNEGSTNAFGTRLTQAPASPTTVTVSRISGDTDLSVSNYATMVFGPGDWNVWQYVTLEAAEDGDQDSDSAVFRGNAEGMTTAQLTAYEVDNDVGDDQDGDGMPDDFETLHFGGPTNGMPYVDSDSDGIHNLGEYISGTIPTNSLSYLKLNYYPAPGTNYYVLYWDSVSNRLYGLLYKSNLFQPFTPWVTDIPATPPMNTYTDDVHDVDANNMYRLTVEME